MFASYDYRSAAPGSIATVGSTDRSVRGDRPRAAPKMPAHGPAAALWLGLGVAGLTLDALVPGATTVHATAALSSLAMLFGLCVFWRHGGGRITAIGMYHFAFALFVGFAGLYRVAASPQAASSGSLLAAVAWCYFLNVVTWLLFWTWEPPPAPDGPSDSDPAVTRWAAWLGVFLLLTAVLIHPLGTASMYIAGAAGFVGAMLLGVGLLRGPSGRLWLFCGVAIGAAFSAYAYYLFNGFGRIVLGSLGFGLLVVLAQRTRGRLVKLVVLLGAAPVLLTLAKLRVHVVEQMRPGLSTRENGLESVTSPLQSFASLLDYNSVGSLPRGWGHTFWAALVVVIPRDFWSGKPVGFGAELVPFISPSMVGTGHSDAALFFGEWLFNFGLPGLLFMVPITGIAMRRLDQFLARVTCQPLDSRGAILRYTAAVVAAAGVIDLVWVGTFGYTSRTAFRLLILAVVFVVVARRTEPARPQLRAAMRRSGRHRRRTGRA
jgi:hypothetical protein